MAVVVPCYLLVDGLEYGNTIGSPPGNLDSGTTLNKPIIGSCGELNMTFYRYMQQRSGCWHIYPPFPKKKKAIRCMLLLTPINVPIVRSITQLMGRWKPNTQHLLAKNQSFFAVKANFVNNLLFRRNSPERNLLSICLDSC